MTVNQVEFDEVLSKNLIIKPYIYASNLKKNYNFTSISKIFIYLDLFEFSNFTVGDTPLKTIYKNGKLNGSIF